MMYRIILTLGILLTAVQLQAQPPELFTSEQLQEASRLAKAAQKDNPAYAIVESLTTEVGPRMAGTEADAKGVQWAINKFNELGFDKVWTEPVTFPTWTRGVEVAQITSPFKQNLVITALGRSVGTPEGGLTGEIIQFDTLDDLISAERGQVEGKIVFISKKMPRFKDGHGYGQTVGARSLGAIEAAKKGAKAIVIRSVGTDSDRMPHTGNMRYEEGVPKIPGAAMSNPDADLVMNMLKRGKPVQIQMTLGSAAGPEYTSYNVIGEITGTTYPDEVVLIGAHLDSWDLGTGAIDDGAGVAIVMAAAERIKVLAKKRPKRTIRVVLFANEEQGLYGGKAYAEQHKENLSKHIVGAESDFGAGAIYKISTKFKNEALPIAKQIQSVLAPFGVEMGSNTASGGPDLIHSRQYGMAVVNLSQDGTDYFDYHHTPNDTLDKIDPDSLSQNVAVYTAFSYLMANLEGDVGFFPPITQ
jgi:hypothetical protein